VAGGDIGGGGSGRKLIGRGNIETGENC